MQKIFLIANWKMQLNKSDSVRLAVEICKSALVPKRTLVGENIQVVICASDVYISDVARKIKGSKIKLGAQNVFYHEKGSYTGEVSIIQLKELAVEYVIIGHSERREYLHETDEDVNRKVKIILDNNLITIICVGETMQERRDGKTDLVLIRQVSKALQDVKFQTDFSQGQEKTSSKEGMNIKEGVKLIIAYEPVWVIGTGQAVYPKEASHVVEVIRYNLLENFSEEIINNNINIIYGGSVDADNINSFLEISLISGALVGGASLSADKFLNIMNKITNNQETITK